MSPYVGKRIAILMAIIFVILCTYVAWARTTVVVVGQGAAAGGGTCGASPYISQTVQNNGFSYGTSATQSITGWAPTSTIQVCKVEIFHGNGTSTSHIEIRSANDGTGTQYGGNSSTLTNPSLNNLETYTWSSNYPELTSTSTYYISIVKDSGSIVLGNANTATESITNYTGLAYDSGATGPNQLTFKVYRIE